MSSETPAPAAAAPATEAPAPGGKQPKAERPYRAPPPREERADKPEKVDQKAAAAAKKAAEQAEKKRKQEEEQAAIRKQREDTLNAGRAAVRKNFKYTEKGVSVDKILRDAEHGLIPTDPVLVCGWVRSVRGQKKFSFIELTDGVSTDTLQCIVDHPEAVPEYMNNLNTGACIEVTGTLIKSVGSEQLVEMKISNVVVHGLTTAKDSKGDPFPIAKAKLPLSVLRETLHMRSRTRVIAAVNRIRNACAYNVHRFFQERGFQYIHTPIITANDCEGAGECFRVTTLMPHDLKGTVKAEDLAPSKDFFNKASMLTVSGQLHVEAFAASAQKVYTFGPTFRAEESNTTRHLAEFWMIEPEVWFINLPQLMNLAEDFIVYLVGKILEEHIDDVMFLSDYQIQAYEDLSEEEKKITRKQSEPLHTRLVNIVSNEFQRITYREALQICNEQLGAKLEFGADLSSDLERFLTEKVFKKPVMVHNYPRAIKSFYMTRCDDDTVEAVDVLVPGIGEIIGGSTREPNLEKLLESMKEKNIPEDSLQWYLDLRRWGSGPHGGFGLGFERLVLLVTGMSNIRDVIPFPRWVNHCAY